MDYRPFDEKLQVKILITKSTFRIGGPREKIFILDLWFNPIGGLITNFQKGLKRDASHNEK
jgi:hypothetical protein